MKSKVRDYAIVSVKVPEGVTVEALPWKGTVDGVTAEIPGKTIKGPSSVTLIAFKPHTTVTPNDTTDDVWNGVGGWGGRSWKP